MLSGTDEIGVAAEEHASVFDVQRFEPTEWRPVGLGRRRPRETLGVEADEAEAREARL
jgi:hypothetical protein